MQPLDVASLLAEPAPLCWDRLTATNSPLAEPPTAASAASDDPLNLALPWLVRHLGVADALAATLAEEGDARQPAGTAQVLPALRRIGFDARLVRCPIVQLRTVRLPAVLLLRCGDACVLTASRVQRDGQHLLSVVMPGQPPLAFEVPAEEVAREYTGMALLVQPVSDRDAPTSTHGPAGTDRVQAPLTRLAQALEAARQAAAAPVPGQVQDQVSGQVPAAGRSQSEQHGSGIGGQGFWARAQGLWQQWRLARVRKDAALAARPPQSPSSLSAGHRYIA